MQQNEKKFEYEKEEDKIKDTQQKTTKRSKWTNIMPISIFICFHIYSFILFYAGILTKINRRNHPALTFIFLIYVQLIFRPLLKWFWLRRLLYLCVFFVHFASASHWLSIRIWIAKWFMHKNISESVVSQRAKVLNGIRDIYTFVLVNIKQIKHIVQDKMKPVYFCVNKWMNEKTLNKNKFEKNKPEIAIWRESRQDIYQFN